MRQDVTILTAKWLATMQSPPLHDGAVAFSAGKILAAGPVAEVRRAYPGAVLQELGDGVLLPGLVNAHTHLELSHCIAGDRPTSFTDWILSLAGRIGPGRDFASAARDGAAESLRLGITCVGDITQHAAVTRSVLSGGPLRVVSYGEVLGIGGSRGKVEGLLASAIHDEYASNSLTIGISPHATYSLEWPDYRKTARVAIDARRPIATHVAELPYEVGFLRDHAGPLRAFLDQIGLWRDEIETYPGRPLALAAAAGLIDYPTLLAHVNYCDDAELAILAAGRASVVYCPRTHAYFGHPPHRWRDMLAAGVNVAVGTDSRASSPDLNLVDDLRLLHQLAPDVPAALLWAMATTHAAKAVGMADHVGSITPGKAADFVAFPVLGGGDPLVAPLEADVLPMNVWIAGKELAGL